MNDNICNKIFIKFLIRAKKSTYANSSYAEKLSANKIFIKGAGHFNPKSNIIEIKEINRIILGE